MCVFYLDNSLLIGKHETECIENITRTSEILGE